MVRQKRLSLVVEYAFGILIVAGLIRTLIYLGVEGYLPSPYFYDIFDTWMDWFNTAWWANDSGTYDSWKSIYPPLSFVFLKIFGIDHCYIQLSSSDARHCDVIGVVTLHSFYLLNIFLVAKSLLKQDRSTALPRSIALVMGLPMTNALDRGNLIVVCFACFLVAFGPLVRSARWKAVAVGLTINFKVYLIASLAAVLLHRRWRWFELGLGAAIAVYLLSYAIYGSGEPWIIAANIRDFAETPNQYNFLDAWNAFTYSPVMVMLSGADSPLLVVTGSDLIEAGLLWLPFSLHVTQLMIVTAAVGIWWRPNAVPRYRSVNLATCLALITAESGAYTLVLILFLTFLEPWEGKARGAAILIAYCLSLPIDVVAYRLPPISKVGFFAGTDVWISYAVTLAPFVRPAVILMLPIALTCATYSDLWQHYRAGRGSPPRFPVAPPFAEACERRADAKRELRPVRDNWILASICVATAGLIVITIWSTGFRFDA